MQKLLQLSNLSSVLKYGVATLLLVIPLYPKFPIFSIPGTYVAVRAEDFLLFVLTLFWLIYLAITNVKEFAKDKLSLALFLFITAGLLSLLSAFFITQTASVSIGVFHWARRIEYILPFFIAYSAVRSGANSRFFIAALFASVVFAFVYGFGQMHFAWPVISTQNEEYAKGIALRWIPGGRLHSTFAGHYDLAAFLLMIFPLAYAYIFVLRRLVTRTLFFALLIVPAFWLFLQTEARVSFIAYLIGVSVTLCVIHKKVFVVPFVLISFVGMVVFSDLGERYMRTINVYLPKLKAVEQINIFYPQTVFAQSADNTDGKSFQEPEDRSASIRLNVEWPRALRAFFKNPLLGTGYSSISLATDNDYLRLLGEVGILGFLAFLLVILRLVGIIKLGLEKLAVLNFEKAFIGGFLGGLIGLLLNATFIDVFEASKVAIVFWTLAGIAVALAKKGLNNAENN